MQRRNVLFGAAGLALGPDRAGARHRSDALPIGAWSAFVASDDPPTLIVLHIKGQGLGTLSIVGMGDIALADLQITSGQVRFALAKPALSFEGRLAGRKEIRGVVRRSGQTVPLVFRRGDLYAEPPLVVLPQGPVTRARLRALRQMSRAPAMGVAWRKRQDDIHVLVDGLRSCRSGIQVEVGDHWHLGSVTKSMTATLAARLVERGLIGWTTTIADALGSRLPEIQPAYRQLNLLHLLSHHGGLARDTPASAYHDAPPGEERLAYVRAALQQPPIGAPEQKMVYSNNDYVVASLMLEVAAGGHWESLIAKEVFAPLGVRGFGFGPPGAPGRLDQPQGHRMGPWALEPVRSDIPGPMAPAGRVNMSLHDLIVYLCAHRDRTEGYLSLRTWETLHRPPFGGDYALGWQVGESGVLFHGGTNSWWKSEVRVDPAQGVACAAVANVLNTNTQSALLQLEDAAERS